MPNSPLMARRQEDEITPLELWHMLLRRRTVILATWITCLGGALAYVLLATPRYEAIVYVDKPLASDIATLNVGRTYSIDLRPYTTEDVFEYFTRELRSDRAFQRFVRTIYLASLANGSAQDSDSHLYRIVRKLLEVHVPDDKGRGRSLYSVRTAANDPKLASEWLGAFLEQVSRDATAKLLADNRMEIDLHIRNMRSELEQMRLTATQKRQDRLAELGEALTIAKSINLHGPQVSALRVPAQDALAPFLDGRMLYARGVKSLSAEVKNLRSRESDDPFVPGLRDGQARLRLLQAIQPDLASLKIFNIDGAIIMPDKPAWPRKLVIFGLATTLGLFAGMALALAVEFTSRDRDRPVCA